MSTHQEGAAFQTNHDVGKLWNRGGAKADIWHVLLDLTEQNINLI